jgi:hypothetical protein
VLGRRTAPLSSVWHVIGWWEARRLVFNLVVGAAGTIACSMILVTAVISEFVFGIPVGMPDPPIFAIALAILFVAGANVCYTGGWVAELLVRRVWAGEADNFATLMFTLGIWFAAVVTLIPGFFISGVALLGGVAHAFGYPVFVPES